MEELAWSDALLTGIDVIDRQHRGLVDMINATAARLADQSELSAEEVRSLVGFLKEYTEVHFSTEEALMSLCGLPPGYAQAHHHNHDRFLALVGDMADELGDDAVPDGRQLLAFLGDWLIRHIRGEDQGLARRLRDARQATDAALSTARSSARSVRAPAAPLLFADALAQGSAALHASEADVFGFIAQDRAAALVVALDASLLPGEVIQANAVAEALFGVKEGGLGGRPCTALFSDAQVQRLPVVMSEVLMHGSFEGVLECAGTDGKPVPAAARVTHLVLNGRIVILVLLSEMPHAASDTRTAPSEDAGRTVLSRHPLFRCLSLGEMARLEQRACLVRFDKSQTLFEMGTMPAGLYVVVSGQVGVFASNERGDEKVLDILVASEIVGEVEVFSSQASPATARSLSSSTLLMIPAGALRKLQTASPAFAAAITAHLGRRMHERAREIAALTLHTAMERTIAFLLEHGTDNGQGGVDAVLPAQKGVIASYLNINGATLSRNFQQLSDAGLISVSRRLVTIPDREALLRFSRQ
ncbi:MAG: bacteriohemerythrin [Azoarcus sp.]|nr:bacteriohemerythrin [Azoarcus sp.]